MEASLYSLRHNKGRDDQPGTWERRTMKEFAGHVRVRFIFSEKGITKVILTPGLKKEWKTHFEPSGITSRPSRKRRSICRRKAAREEGSGPLKSEKSWKAT